MADRRKRNCGDIDAMYEGIETRNRAETYRNSRLAKPSCGVCDAKIDISAKRDIAAIM